jgi:hypothetical protein
VTINDGPSTTVDAINCQRAVTTITRTAPRVEGGIAVAPRTFGRFGGDLIAPDENSGRIFAITPSGRSLLIAASGLTHGGDIGVESEGFVPPGTQDALLADRLTPGNPHPGDDVVLRIGAGALTAAGVRPGDLLVATEGGALTDAASCTAGACRSGSWLTAKARRTPRGISGSYRRAEALLGGWPPQPLTNNYDSM